MRIAICHQTFAHGDAIGNDILGMWQLLKACGHDPFILCENKPNGINRCEISSDFSDASTATVDLVIYHHSQAWETGRALLEHIKCPIAFKFHNITPPAFFAPYSPNYANISRLGQEQTLELVKHPNPHVWLCDSIYNMEIILAAGESRERCHIAPPFNRVDAILNKSSQSQILTTAETLRFLFVSRFAPNKGHLALLEFCAAYRTAYGANFEMLIIGAIDPAFEGYWLQFAAQVRTLNLTEIVRVYNHLPNDTVQAFFVEAHVYVTFSEHEGFCVPVIEAQAVGLPVVGSDATAIREIAGNGQFLASFPVSVEDFTFYATLAHAAACDQQVRDLLINNGHRNILSRFTTDAVENAFLAPLLPWLLPRRP